MSDPGDEWQPQPGEHTGAITIGTSTAWVKVWCEECGMWHMGGTNTLHERLATVEAERNEALARVHTLEIRVEQLVAAGDASMSRLLREHEERNQATARAERAERQRDHLRQFAARLYHTQADPYAMFFGYAPLNGEDDDGWRP